MMNTEFQTSFAKLVQGQATHREQELLFEELDPRYSHRLGAYPQSYQGRVISVLGSTVLAQLQTVLGPEVVRQLLSVYFQSRIASEIMISDTLSDFPEFIKQNGDDSNFCRLAQSVAELCIKYWNLAKGPDPSTQREKICQATQRTLVKNSVLVKAPRNIHLFNAWMKTEDSNTAPHDYYTKNAASVLILKTTSRSIVSILVDHSFTEIVEELCSGKTLQQAVGSVSQEDLSKLCPDKWFQFIQNLNRENCWAEDLI